MKNINVKIIDEYTLELAQDGKQGDRIDLKKVDENSINKSQISSAISKRIEVEKKTAIEQERERIEAQKELEKQLALSTQEKELKDKYLEQKRDLEKQVVKLTAEQESINKTKEQEIEIAVANKEKELQEKYSGESKELGEKVAKLTAEKQNLEQQKEMEIKLVKRESEVELSNKETFYKQLVANIEQERDRWKEYQHSLSTKDFGNKLEVYCDNEFDSMTWLPVGTTFKSDTIGETKGDRIYKEVDKDGNEVLSIMFEIKNERDDTKEKDKQTNKKFFAKLDKDRTNKKCEYAVLVSLLEADNKNYDAPFVVREYEKMFVIRPQHFKYIIENLRMLKGELAHTNMQLAETKKQNIDIVNFKQNWGEFLKGFGNSVNLAAKHFVTLRAQLVTERDNKQKQIEELDLIAKHLDQAFKKGEKADFPKMLQDSQTLLLQFTDELKEKVKSKKTS